jgi:hypothetical protein
MLSDVTADVTADGVYRQQHAWRYFAFLAGVPACIACGLTLWALPESPRFLAMQVGCIPVAITM